MLMNLLPGLRELRTPLAAGYIWFLAIWFAVNDHIPARDGATGVALSVYRLKDLLGTPALIAAASFVAYILGSAYTQPDTVRRSVLLVARWWPLRWLQRVFIRDMTSVEGYPSPPISPNTRTALYERIERLARQADPQRFAAMGGENMHVDDVWSDVVKNLKDLPLKLQVEKPDIYQGYDRKAAEADFRVNVGLAIGGLSITLAIFAGSAWFAAGLVATVVMLRSGIYRQQRANDLRVETLTSEVISSRELNDYDQNLRMGREDCSQPAQPTP
ncbi:hypothetical protein [Kitasatospora griseola]|uniref:hypothetical protein n=1 Tax=Kitasatospora griseola TaxID=2064 RepID=UPI003813DE56